MSESRCKENVWDSGGWRKYKCSRKAVVDGYCRQHHPSAVEKRKQEKAAKEEARWQASPVMRLERAKARIAELEAENERLRAAILDLKAYWYADPDQSTWGGALPRLFQALETDDER